MTNTTKCPKCGYSSDIAFEECPQCEVVIEKFMKIKNSKEKQQKIEELEKKIIEKEKKIKRIKYGWFKKQKSKKVAIIAGIFVLILFCGYGIKSYENTAIKENDYAKLGLQYFEWGDYKQSKEYFTKAIESDPKNYSLWLNRGVCWNQLGKFDEALQDYQYARMLKPNYPLIEKNIRITLGNKTKYNARVRSESNSNRRESVLKAQRQMNELNERIKQQQADQNRRYEQLQREAKRQREYNRRATEEALRKERERRKNDEWHERAMKAADWDWKHAGDDPRYKRNPYR